MCLYFSLMGQNILADPDFAFWHLLCFGQESSVFYPREKTCLFEVYRYVPLWWPLLQLSFSAATKTQVFGTSFAHF